MPDQPTPRADCPFCPSDTAKPRLDDFDTVLASFADCRLTPTLGMFIEGYFLLIANAHITSFGHLPDQALSNIEQQIDDIIATFAPYFGSYLTFEHGSAGTEASGRPACIEHAHIHLIPVADVAGDHLRRELGWSVIPSFVSLATFDKLNYFYLALGGEHLILPDSKLPSQWIRREVASVLGVDNWDWAAYAGRRELRQTLSRIRVEKEC
jgi:hypothetical protein